MTEINWSRGFFRLWLVMSALWIAPVAYSQRDHMSFAALHQLRSADPVADETPEQAQLSRMLAEVDAVLQKQTIEAILLVVGPPIVLLIMGLIVAWIAGGFARRI